MKISEAQQVRRILRTIEDCERAIKHIETNIETRYLHISGADNFIRERVPDEVKEQVKEIVINAYKKKIEETERELEKI